MKVRSSVLITCCIFKVSVQYGSILVEPCLDISLNGYEKSMCTWLLPVCNFLVTEASSVEAKPLSPFSFISTRIKQFFSSCCFFLLNGNRLNIDLFFFPLKMRTLNCHWLHSSSSAGAVYFILFFLRLKSSTHNISNKS